MNLEKRKLPRFQITPCQFHDEELAKNFSVQDISAGGLAVRLVDSSDLVRFAVGTEHRGLIKLEGKRLPVSFQVKYLRGTLFGAEWQSPSSELLELLSTLLEPRRLGSALRAFEIPDSSSTLWLHNSVGVDALFYAPSHKSDQGAALSRFTLFVHQNFVQWELEEGVKTGRALAEADEGYAHGIVRLETRLLEFHDLMDRKLVDLAIQILVNIDSKYSDQVNFIVTKLRGALMV